MHTGLVPEHLNVLRRPAHCRTLQKWTFILRFHCSDLDRAERRPF